MANLPYVSVKNCTAVLERIPSSTQYCAGYTNGNLKITHDKKPKQKSLSLSHFPQVRQFAKETAGVPKYSKILAARDITFK